MSEASNTGESADEQPQAASTPQQVSLRQQYVVGRPPRIGPMNADQLGAEAVQTAARIAAAAGSRNVVSTAADVPEILATLLRHPSLTESIMDLATHLYVKGALSARDRELLALRTEWLTQTPFEWGEHVGIAKAVGLSSEEIDRVAQGSNASGWSEDDRALLRAAEELHADAMISDEVWKVLARRLNEKQLFEVAVVVGHYTMTAYFENSLRLRLRPGNSGLNAR